MAVVIAVEPDHVPMARPRSPSVERCTDEGKTAGNEKRRSDALYRAGCD